MELDHVFIFVEPDGPEISYLRTLGLIETYRRKHRGQGTENVCFCFENIFLECLWVNDPAEVASEQIARTRLWERSQWRKTGACPFGFAWRDEDGSLSARIATWPFKPPYLPVDMSIDVAIDGDDIRQPMMFRSPGNQPPAAWPAEKSGNLQRSSGLGHVLSVRLGLPAGTVASPALMTIAAATILTVETDKQMSASIVLTIEREGGAVPLQLALPATTPFRE